MTYSHYSCARRLGLCHLVAEPSLLHLLEHRRITRLRYLKSVARRGRLVVVAPDLELAGMHCSSRSRRGWIIVVRVLLQARVMVQEPSVRSEMGAGQELR